MCLTPYTAPPLVPNYPEAFLFVGSGSSALVASLQHHGCLSSSILGQISLSFVTEQTRTSTLGKAACPSISPTTSFLYSASVFNTALVCFAFDNFPVSCPFQHGQTGFPTQALSINPKAKNLSAIFRYNYPTLSLI